jgi:biopolymer transport protein ExbD
MRRRLHRRAGRYETVNINIAAFMNLLVILVPFLLMTAAFTRITILESNLPAGATQEPQSKQRFDLEITVRADGIEVGDRQGGLIRRIAPTVSGQDLAQLSGLLQQIKARFPDMLLVGGKPPSWVTGRSRIAC